jgi:hypothetical protein
MVEQRLGKKNSMVLLGKWEIVVEVRLNEN